MLINIDENTIGSESERPLNAGNLSVRAVTRFDSPFFHRWPAVQPHPRLPTRNVEEPEKQTGWAVNWSRRRGGMAGFIFRSFSLFSFTLINIGHFTRINIGWNLADFFTL
jgi:hypothetical protein